MECKSLGLSLGALAEHLPDYSIQLRQAGFSCVHVNDDWIGESCSAQDVAIHKRYLVEMAREVLSTGNWTPDSGDELNCRSAWLNERKAERFAKYGPYEILDRSWETRHLKQISPGWREFHRIRESPVPIDQMHYANQLGTSAYRRSKELEVHAAGIAQLRKQMPKSAEEPPMRAFFAQYMTTVCAQWGGQSVLTMRRNQVFKRDEQIMAVAFDIAQGCCFVIKPSVTTQAWRDQKPKFQGSMSVGFRLMTPEAIASTTFDFSRDVVLHLDELLPNKFNGYSRFENKEEFCLNILANATAVRVLLPDVLRTLCTTALTKT